MTIGSFARRWPGAWRRSTTRSPAGSRRGCLGFTSGPPAGERCDPRSFGGGSGGSRLPGRPWRQGRDLDRRRGDPRRGLGREVRDVDLAVARDEGQAAREIGAFAAGHAFKLSEEFASWRALAGDGAWHVDITRLRGDGIEADLAMRDFTVNAIAVPLADLGAPLVDPHGGLADLERRVLRAVSAPKLRRRPVADPQGGPARRRSRDGGRFRDCRPRPRGGEPGGRAGRGAPVR